MPKLTDEEKQERRFQRERTRARDKALRAEEDHLRNQAQSERFKRENMYLTWEEYQAGEPCRGCGKPLMDQQDTELPPNKLTEQQREAREADVIEFKHQHGECRSYRWSAGSQTTHCGFCCPSPPIGPQTLARVAELFSIRTPDEDLDEWELTLTCEHVTHCTAHRTNHSYSIGVVTCPECEQPRGIVTSQRLGPVNDPHGRIQQQRINAELQQAQDKLRRQEKATAKTRQRIAELQAQTRNDTSE